MKKGLLAIVVFVFITAAFLAGCDYVADQFDGEDKPDDSCSLGVNVSSLGVSCKYHVTIMLYCDKDIDYIEWSFDDGYWSDMDMNGRDRFTFEQQFPGVGTYAINVIAWRKGEIVASKSDGLTIDCK